MFEVMFWLVVGAFVGWNFPQPAYAKSFQERYLQKYIDKVKNFVVFWK